MNWLQRLVRRERLEHELDAEMRFHLEQLTGEYRAAGLSEPDARRRACREFGAVEAIKDDCRRVRGTDWLLDVLADARVGLRGFLKEPGFSCVAVGALALGLGVNTVFFSIVNTYCLTGLPYPSATQLADLSIRDDLGQQRPLSPAQVRAVADLPLVERLGYYATRTGAVRTEDSIATRRTVAYVSGDLLALIGETPARGRAFRPSEYGDAHATTVLIAAELARELFGSETAAVGRGLRVGGASSTIVGVLPDGSRFPDNADVWAPLSSLALSDDAPALTLFLRLKERAPIGSAAATIEAALRQEGVLRSDRLHLSLVPLNDRYHGRVTDPVWIAFITAGLLVVLIACSNVSNLLLARGVRRTNEIAVRLSLGATRARIVRQLLAETLVLVMAACAASLFLGWVGLHALLAAIPKTAIPYWSTLDLSLRAVFFVVGIGALTVLLSGMAPALQLVKVPRVPFTARTATQGRAIGRWSSAFLVIQISLSVLLLCGVGITVQVYQTLANAAAETQLAQVLSAGVTLSSQRYAATAARERFLLELRRQLLSTGKVTFVSIGGALPGTRGEPRTVAGGTIHEPGGLVSTIGVDSTFFSTLGVGMVSGQQFTDRDGDRSGSSVVVNDRFAQLFFGTRGVVGQQVRLQPATAGGAPDTRTIAGVVQLPGANPAVNGPPLMFVPRAVGSSVNAILLIRGTAPPDQLAAALRESVKRLDPDVPLSNVVALPAATREANWNARVSQTLISAIAFVGLWLAMIGVAALTAHRVATRARELSIRVALGATPAMLVREVLGPVMVQLSMGLIGGALLAKGWQRTSSDDLAVVAVLVCATTLLFSVWPARRAARVNPITALHAEG